MYPHKRVDLYIKEILKFVKVKSITAVENRYSTKKKKKNHPKLLLLQYFTSTDTNVSSRFVNQIWSMQQLNSRNTFCRNNNFTAQILIHVRKLSWCSIARSAMWHLFKCLSKELLRLLKVTVALADSPPTIMSMY